MEIQVLASSSEGNAYIVGDGMTQLLLECGIPCKEIQRKNDFVLPDACLVSHSHGDHSQSVTDLQRLGIPCYMSKDTFTELLDKHKVIRSVKIMEHRKTFQVGSFVICPFEMKHDVYCFGFFIYSMELKESLFFATDTSYIPYKYTDSFDYIMVEANYDIDILNDRIMNGYIEPAMKGRLARAHMEIGATILWLKKQNLEKTKRIYLLHLSHGSSNADEFKRRVEECTGIPCTIA